MSISSSLPTPFEGPAPMQRLWNAQTGRYLHLSGSGETRDETYSWLGYKYQANNLRIETVKRGDPWPYTLQSRDYHVPGKEGGWA